MKKRLCLAIADHSGVSNSWMSTQTIKNDWLNSQAVVAGAADFAKPPRASRARSPLLLSSQKVIRCKASDGRGHQAVSPSQVTRLGIFLPPARATIQRGPYGPVCSTTRKPTSLQRRSGPSQPRMLVRQFLAQLIQDPPRMTRPGPAGLPCGSLAAASGKAPYQSEHHSQTLPCMSYRPQALG